MFGRARDTGEEVGRAVASTRAVCGVEAAPNASRVCTRFRVKKFMSLTGRLRFRIMRMITYQQACQVRAAVVRHTYIFDINQKFSLSDKIFPEYPLPLWGVNMQTFRLSFRAFVSRCTTYHGSYGVCVRLHAYFMQKHDIIGCACFTTTDVESFAHTGCPS